jgi:hypothetical protein
MRGERKQQKSTRLFLLPSFRFRRARDFLKLLLLFRGKAAECSRFLFSRVSFCVFFKKVAEKKSICVLGCFFHSRERKRERFLPQNHSHTTSSLHISL